MLTRGMVYQCTAEKNKNKHRPWTEAGRPSTPRGRACSGGEIRRARSSTAPQLARARPRPPPAEACQKWARGGPGVAAPSHALQGPRISDERRSEKLHRHFSVQKSALDFHIFFHNFFPHFLSPILSSPFSILARLMHWPPTSPRRGRRAAALAGGQLHGARDKASAGEGCAGDASR